MAGFHHHHRHHHPAGEESHKVANKLLLCTVVPGARYHNACQSKWEWNAPRQGNYFFFFFRNNNSQAPHLITNNKIYEGAHTDKNKLRVKFATMMSSRCSRKSEQTIRKPQAGFSRRRNQIKIIILSPPHTFHKVG